MNINDIKKLYGEIKRIDDEKRSISEIDTQIFLIEPILHIAGWNLTDPNTIKRTSRNNKAQEFDIELYKDNTLAIAIECKAIGSDEFCKSKANGKLKEDFSCFDKDGLGQLRSYCYRYSHFKKDNTLAILTNGYEWLLFNNCIFLNNLHDPITDRAIEQRATLEDDKFEENIIKKIIS